MKNHDIEKNKYRKNHRWWYHMQVYKKLVYIRAWFWTSILMLLFLCFCYKLPDSQRHGENSNLYIDFLKTWRFIHCFLIHGCRKQLRILRSVPALIPKASEPVWRSCNSQLQLLCRFRKQMVHPFSTITWRTSRFNKLKQMFLLPGSCHAELENCFMSKVTRIKQFSVESLCIIWYFPAAFLLPRACHRSKSDWRFVRSAP